MYRFTMVYKIPVSIQGGGSKIRFYSHNAKSCLLFSIYSLRFPVHRSSCQGAFL